MPVLWPELLSADFSPEFEIRTSRSGGPGGQNVNKVETKVELRFDVSQSRILSEAQKAYLRGRWEGRLAEGGVLVLQSQEKRSQLDNRQEAVRKFYCMLRLALDAPKKRAPTKPSAGAKVVRLKAKKAHAEKKLRRQKWRPE